MLFGRLELHRGHLEATELGQDLARALLPRGLGERPAQARCRRARSAAPRRVAAADLSISTLRRSPVAAVKSRCAVTRSGDAPSRASASAAAACRAWRSPGARSSYSAARTIGWTNPRRSTPAKMSARTRSSAAAGRVVAQTRDPSGELSSLSSPSTATALASSLAAGPSVASRCRTKRLTAAGPTACTSLAAPADGSTPAASRAPEQLPQEQGVAAGRRMTRAAELLGRLRAQALPRQSHRGGLAQRSRVQRDRLGTRRHLRPQRPGRVRESGGRPARSIATGSPRCAAPGRPGTAASRDRPTGNRRPRRAAEPGRRGSRPASTGCAAPRSRPSAPGDCRSSGSNSAPRDRPRRRTDRAPGSLADHGLQQLAHDAERKRLLELRAPRLERHHAGPSAAARASRTSSVLPTPAGPSTSSSVPSPAHARQGLRAAPQARARARAEPT